MYYMTARDIKASRYFSSLETFTEEQAENAIKFCCSIAGCNREEQAYLLEWFFDGVFQELVQYGNSGRAFGRLLDFCGAAYIVQIDDPEYDEYRDCLYDGCQIAGEVLPTCNLFVYDI